MRRRLSWRLQNEGKSGYFYYDEYGSQSMQGHQGSAQDMIASFCKHKTQEFGVPRGENLLEPHTGRVGGFARGRNFIPGNSGGGRNNNVSVPVSEQTVQSHSTVVQQKFHSTGPLDWTQVGGAILEGEGVCIYNVDILPRWEHPHF